MTEKKYTTRPFESIAEMLISHKKQENVIFTYKKKESKNDTPKIMPRKNINMSEAQFNLIRDNKKNYVKAMDLNSLTDIEYVLKISDIIDRSLKIRSK